MKEGRYRGGGGERLPLTTAEFGEGLFPYFAQADFDFEAVGDLFTLGRVEFGEASRE